jgi:hypothetical protein
MYICIHPVPPPLRCSQEQCLKSEPPCSHPLEARNLLPCKYFRQSLAQALGVPVERMVRVGRLHGATREESMEATLQKHASVCAEEVSAVQSGTPAKRARCSNTVPCESENSPGNNSRQSAGSAWGRLLGFLPWARPQEPSDQSPGTSTESVFPPF